MVQDVDPPIYTTGFLRDSSIRRAPFRKVSRRNPNSRTNIWICKHIISRCARWPASLALTDPNCQKYKEIIDDERLVRVSAGKLLKIFLVSLLADIYQANLAFWMNHVKLCIGKSNSPNTFGKFHCNHLKLAACCQASSSRMKTEKVKWSIASFMHTGKA